MSEVMTIFTASVVGFTVLKAPHLLWINLITACFPALALGMEPGEKDIMKKRPRAKNEGIFSGGLGFDLIYQGILVTLLTLAAYFIGYVTMGGEMTLHALDTEAGNMRDCKGVRRYDGVPHHVYGGDIPFLQHALTARFDILPKDA